MTVRTAVLLDETGAVSEMPAVGGKPVNTVGAGDSVVAAMVYGMEKGFSMEEKIALAMAMGAAPDEFPVAVKAVK